MADWCERIFGLPSLFLLDGGLEGLCGQVGCGAWVRDTVNNKNMHTLYEPCLVRGSFKGTHPLQKFTWSLPSPLPLKSCCYLMVLQAFLRHTSYGRSWFLYLSSTGHCPNIPPWPGPKATHIEFSEWVLLLCSLTWDVSHHALVSLTLQENETKCLDHIFCTAFLYSLSPVFFF